MREIIIIMMTKPHQHQYRSNPPHFHQHQWHVWQIYRVKEHPPLQQWAAEKWKKVAIIKSVYEMTSPIAFLKKGRKFSFMK